MISRDVILAGFRAFVATALPNVPEDRREQAVRRHMDNLESSILSGIHAAIVAAVEADRAEPWSPEGYPVPTQRVPALRDLVGLDPDFTGGKDPAEYVADQYRD